MFLETDGDLAAVTRALVSDERFYDPRSYRAKVKQPFEFVVSALRATDAELGPAAAVLLDSHPVAMQLSPYSAPAPTGYPTTSADWVGTGAMLDRMNLALQISTNALEYAGQAAPNNGTRIEKPTQPAVLIDPWRMLDLGADAYAGPVPTGFSDRVLSALLSRLLDGTPTSGLRAMIPAELGSRPEGTDPGALLRSAIALVLGSPEFQRH